MRAALEASAARISARGGVALGRGRAWAGVWAAPSSTGVGTLARVGSILRVGPERATGPMPEPGPLAVAAGRMGGPAALPPPVSPGEGWSGPPQRSQGVAPAVWSSSR